MMKKKTSILITYKHGNQFNIRLLTYYLSIKKFWAIMVIITILFTLHFSRVVAQQIYWAAQEKLPEYYDSTEEPPFLIADLNHVVHAFNAQPIDLEDNTSPKAIFYRQWTFQNGWSVPNDIFFDESRGNLELATAIHDQTGHVHIFLQKNYHELYYSQSLLSLAASSTSWSVPTLVTNNSTIISPGLVNIGAAAIDEGGEKLLFIYSGSDYGNGLYYVFSSDSGASWSTPYQVYLAPDQDLLITDPELIFDNSGIYHAVWSTFENDGSAGPGYYSRFDPESNIWSNPMELDTPGIRTPSIIETNGNIFISYYHARSNGNWWRRSTDGGNTWTHPKQVSPLHIGTNGGLSFVVDSSETLHAFFGERINDDNHGMWHTTWMGTYWTNPEAVVKGPQVRDDVGGASFDPRSARAVVSNGNLILVTWGTDGAAGLNGAWYSYKNLDTPELPIQQLPLPTEPSSITASNNNPIPTSSIIIKTTPTIAIEKNRLDAQSSYNPQFPIIIGTVSVIIVVFALVAIKILFHVKNI
jgi:hypothetical protein